MNILIAGGTGFIGSALIEHFSKAQHRITILTRKAKLSNNPFVSYRDWDGKTMPMAIGIYDVVINLVGASIAEERWTPEYKQQLLDSRINSMKACVDYINSCTVKPKVFLAASAIGYYGGDNPQVCTEKSEAANDFMGNLCQQWELASQGAACRTVNMRIGVILGKGGGAYKEMAPIYKAGLGGRFASGKQGMSWMHLEDLVKAIQFLIDKEEISGAVNLTAPEWAAQEVFSKALAKSLHRPHLFTIPRFALDILFGERSILFWGGQKVVPTVLLEQKFSFSFPNLEKAFEDLAK